MRRELGMFIALLMMCASLGFWLSDGKFLGQSNLMSLTRQIGMLGIYSIGIGFVIITGGIDLSIGSVIGLTGVLVAKLSSQQPGCAGYPIWVGITVAMTVAILIGLGQGLLITRMKLQPFIVTLGVMLALRGVSQTIVKGGALSFGRHPFKQLAKGGLLIYHGDPILPYPLLMFIVVIILATYVLHFTVFGRYVYAIGGNRDAAEYCGINVKRVETTAYVISAALAGLGGIFIASYAGEMSQQVGIGYELPAIAAVVLGGCSLRGGEGTILGMVIGSAIMKVIDNGIIMFNLPIGATALRLDTNWTFIIIGAVILIAVILDQVVHIVQGKRRTRRAGALVAARQRGMEAASS